RALKVISTILEELQSVCNDISDEEYCSLVSLLKQDCTIYFAGEGRSGLVAKARSEEHTSELQSRFDLVCRLLLEKKKKKNVQNNSMRTDEEKRHKRKKNERKPTRRHRTGRKTIQHKNRSEKPYNRVSSERQISQR